MMLQAIIVKHVAVELLEAVVRDSPRERVAHIAAWLNMNFMLRILRQSYVAI